MTYQQTVDWMFQQLPMYQRVGTTAYRHDLANIQKLAAHLGQPHKKFRSLHVGGTNGKGSVSHMLASVLQESGYKVGLYTSPHLKDFRERIRINGKEIKEDVVVEFMDSHRSFFEEEQFSFFEMTVGLAFDFFAREAVDIAVVEVGLGGRLDSTNILSPELAVITNIGLDHTAFLGTTLQSIAAEKAGIIKPGTPIVIGEDRVETLPVFKKYADAVAAPLYRASAYEGRIPETDLKGVYQQKNLRTVVAVTGVLRELKWRITDRALAAGLRQVVRNTGLRGRWEVLRERPRVICDTAHNREGLQEVVHQLLQEEFEKLLVVFGVVRDKDLESILELLPPNAEYFFCRPDIPRGMEAQILMEKAAEKGCYGSAYSSVSAAYASALEKASEKDLIYAGGSTFTVAEII